MKVKELMSAPVVTFSPGTPLKEVASVLVARGISGAPVVDEGGRVLGVVSAGDILVRERGWGRARFDLLAWLSESESTELEARLHARTAGEAMSHPAVTIPADGPLAKAAAYMVDRGVNRLPVVNAEGKLVGIVSRADLVRAFARSDAELEREIREDVVAGAFLWCSPGHVRVEVSEGDVVLTGEVESRDVAEMLAATVERVPGVLSVRSELRWSGDREELPAAP
jgi:CBS domain-containing protein